MIFSTSTLSRMLCLYNITRCYGKHVAVFAVAVAAGDMIKYQSFVYGSFVWGIHVRYNKIKYKWWNSKISQQSLFKQFFSIMKTMLSLKSFTFRIWPIYSFIHILLKTIKFEPVHEIFNNVVCATSKAAVQPAHTRSLTRAFASRFRIL